MFNFITMNLRGHPLRTTKIIVEPISATTTSTGLTVQAAYEPN